ncbi:MAG: hypothetical protein KIS94_10275 [Chitinophagales bacterium]|nr:hypothetical protein [Chitinophagales bacterium]
MRALAILTVVLFLITACKHKVKEENAVVTKDTVVIVQRDTVVIIEKDTQQKAVPASKQTQPIQQKEVVDKTIPAKVSNDTIYHYYVNKKVSAKITPWADGERWVLLYDLYGEETYRHKDIRKSYSVIARLSFHPNGAVSKMLISENPGASQYWYETTITFSTTNDPEQKASERKPYEDLRVEPKPWEYWDKKTKQWRKQEVQE